MNSPRELYKYKICPIYTIASSGGERETDVEVETKIYRAPVESRVGRGEPSRVLGHSAKLSANFADEFTSARGFDGVITSPRDSGDEVVETTLTNYTSLLRAAGTMALLVTRMDRNDQAGLPRGNTCLPHLVIFRAIFSRRAMRYKN